MSSSISPECTPLKHKYDACFNDWYMNKFLKGESTTNICGELFEEYKACVERALQAKGITPLLEDSRQESPFDAK